MCLRLASVFQGSISSTSVPAGCSLMKYLRLSSCSVATVPHNFMWGSTAFCTDSLPRSTLHRRSRLPPDVHPRLKASSDVTFAATKFQHVHTFSSAVA
eukprot:9488077-Pyramimonas_sp.AAC.2